MAYTTIDKPTDYFNTVLYTGNGSDNHTIQGVGYQPDMIWIKERSSTSSHYLTSVGLGIGTRLEPNETSTEATEGISAVTSDGFTIGTSTNQVNENGQTYASWNWKETATAGFDIVSYTGNGSARTISHSLSAIPKMIIIKNRDDTDSWRVYHASTGNGGSLMLNLTNAFASDSTMWNNTSPTSSVFSLGDHDNVNGNGHKFIAYCFAEKKGYSKFGSYTGNGNADGTFVYTGFKPAWLLVKSTASNDWILQDTKRNPHNVSNVTLFPNGSDADVTNTIYNQDILSNGFKARTTHARLNGSGVSYIYMAFAEQPFVTSTGVPATAR